MKKGLLVVTLALLGNAIFAQTLDDVKKYVLLNKYEDAKTQIDKFMLDPKNAAKADGWYYKGVIYNEVSKINATCTTCKIEAFEAFKKYQVMDAKNTWMNEEQNVRLFDLYNGFFDLGSKAYNAKDYKSAFDNFKNANTVGNYVNTKGFAYNGFKFPALDTSLILNIALAARLGNNDASAAEYYEKLAAIEVKGPDNIEMYEYLCNYYASTKNMSSFNNIITKGKKLYTDHAFWVEKEIDMVDSKDKRALIAKYEEILASNTLGYTLAYNYAVELFNFTFITDPRPTDYNDLKVKSKNAISNALKISNTADANLLMARALYNDSYDMQEEINKIKGAKPEDVKKKAEKKAAMNKTTDECIKYAENAASEFSKLTSYNRDQKKSYKSTYGLLVELYGLKANNTKVQEAKKNEERIEGIKTQEKSENKVEVKKADN
jgi:hypothetical protein